MRADGMPLRDIAAVLEVSLSSAWLWTRDTAVPAPLREVATVTTQPDPRTAPCGRCRRELSLSCFHWSGRQRQSWCRDCRREYMRARGDLHRQQTHEARRRRRNAARQHLLEFLEINGCTDCALIDRVVMEFDHLGEKRANIADLVAHGYSLGAIEHEMASCELVCVNCHRRRTAQRAGSWRVEPEQLSRDNRRPLRQRNRALILTYLSQHSCVDCGEDDLIVLDFDHVGRKRANVVDLVWSEYSIARIQEEISECVVRCANCHRRRTCKTGGHFRNHAVKPP
jgi:hypothetical protein